LQERRRHPALFVGGDYVPLAVEGAGARHVFAFARCTDERVAVVIVPRLVGSLGGSVAAAPIGAAVWRDTVVVLPPVLRVGPLTDALGGVRIAARASASGVALADALAHFPAALLRGTRRAPVQVAKRPS
jgi:(1->4)-alpha-D-glucan 1-alpha-D-glucosylmutase